MRAARLRRDTAQHGKNVNLEEWPWISLTVSPAREKFCARDYLADRFCLSSSGNDLDVDTNNGSVSLDVRDSDRAKKTLENVAAYLAGMAGQRCSGCRCFRDLR